MRKYSKTVVSIGLISLAVIIILLFSGPHYFSSSVSFLDTDLSKSAGDERPVRVKLDFGHQDELTSFPYRIGEWMGRDDDIEGLKEQLGAETLIKRSYSSGNPFRPVFLLLMQSENQASFHPPTVCYRALGYDIKEDTKDIVSVTDTSWTSKWMERDIGDMPEWAQEEWRYSPEYGMVSVKKLIINHNERTDRRVVLYVYIKDNTFTSYTVSMLRVSTEVPPYAASYEEATEIAKEFMGDVIPLLFEPEEDDSKLFLTYIVDWGITGYCIVTILFVVPLVLIVFPIFLSLKRKYAAQVVRS